MECIIAYLLLTLFIDLALEIARMDCTADEAEWIKRSLWGQAPFDCGSRAVSAMTTVPRQHVELRRNRFRTVSRKKVYAASTNSAKQTRRTKGDFRPEPSLSYAIM